MLSIKSFFSTLSVIILNLWTKKSSYYDEFSSETKNSENISMGMSSVNLTLLLKGYFERPNRQGICKTYRA